MITLLMNFEVSLSKVSSDSTYSGFERSINNLGKVKYLIVVLFGFMW